MKTRTFLKPIRSVKQATLRAFFILISLPTATLAGVKIDDNFSLDYTLTLKVFSLGVASLLGGIGSSFVTTTFDDGVKHIRLFKILVGACLGTFSGLAIIDNTQIGIFSIILPVFIIASLGAPIMVFYLMWLSNPETQVEIKETIKQKVRDKLGVSK